MAFFVIRRQTPLPAAEAWRRLTDWPRHGAHVPLSRVTVRPPGPTRVGTTMVVRTGVGRMGFDDPMEVVCWQPPTDGEPGRCHLEKRGTTVVGWAEIEVSAVPSDRAGSLVVWREDARVRALPRRLFDPPTALACRLVFGRIVTGLLNERPGTGG